MKINIKFGKDLRGHTATVSSTMCGVFERDFYYSESCLRFGNDGFDLVLFLLFLSPFLFLGVPT